MKPLTFSPRRRGNLGYEQLKAQNCSNSISGEKSGCNVYVSRTEAAVNDSKDERGHAETGFDTSFARFSAGPAPESPDIL